MGHEGSDLKKQSSITTLEFETGDGVWNRFGGPVRENCPPEQREAFTLERIAFEDRIQKGDAPVPPLGTITHVWVDCSPAWTPPLFAINETYVLVDQSIRTIIERFDPGRHAFIDISIKFQRKPARPLGEGQRWLVYVTEFKKTVVSEPFDEAAKWNSHIPLENVRPICYGRDAHDGVHLWREEVQPERLFLSRALANAIVEAGQPWVTFRQDLELIVH